MHKQVFKKIENSTIINESLVKDSQIADQNGDEVRKALTEIAKFIEKSQNQKAGEKFSKFNCELKEPNYQKSRLRQLWKEIETALPTISTLTDSVTKISSLFI
jgi:lipopolysaccharide biosynthesis regulator YciM